MKRPFTPMGSASSDFRGAPGSPVRLSIQPMLEPLNHSGACWMGKSVSGFEEMPWRRRACQATWVWAIAESCRL